MRKTSFRSTTGLTSTHGRAMLNDDMDVYEALRRSRVGRAIGVKDNRVTAHASAAGVVLSPGDEKAVDFDHRAENCDTCSWSLVLTRPDVRRAIDSLDWRPVEPRGLLTMIAEAAR